MHIKLGIIHEFHTIKISTLMVQKQSAMTAPMNLIVQNVKILST